MLYRPSPLVTTPGMTECRHVRRNAHAGIPTLLISVRPVYHRPARRLLLGRLLLVLGFLGGSFGSLVGFLEQVRIGASHREGHGHRREPFALEAHVLVLLLLLLALALALLAALGLLLGAPAALLEGSNLVLAGLAGQGLGVDRRDVNRGRGIGALRLVLARAGQALGLQRLADLLDQRIALGDDLVTEDRNQLGIPRIQRAAQAQAHAAALRIDADDAQDELLALRHDLLRMLDALVGQLGHVDQALDAILDASERTEVGELRDRALDQLPNLVGARNAAPRLRAGALDRQGNLALVGVDAEDVNVHFLANLEQFAWVADTAPAQLGEVNESVSAPNVDEGAEVADRGDATRADLALLELLDELLLHRSEERRVG